MLGASFAGLLVLWSVFCFGLLEFLQIHQSLDFFSSVGDHYHRMSGSYQRDHQLGTMFLDQFERFYPRNMIIGSIFNPTADKHWYNYVKLPQNRSYEALELINNVQIKYHAPAKHLHNIK